MNPYLLLILSILIISYLLDTIVEVLNLSHLSPTLPKRLAKLINPKKYKKSQAYLKTTTRFSLLQSTTFLPPTLAFIILGGFNLLDLFARSFGFLEITTGLIVTLSLLLITTLLNLPFAIYSTFVIEAKFGFNKTTPKTFILDLTKSLSLTILIGAPILALIIFLFQSAGSTAWLIAWFSVTLIQLFLVFIAPITIMPLFNKFTPLPHGQLKTAIEKLTRSQNFQLQGIYTMDGSRRSTKSNAFFTGFGRYKRIVLFDTLIKKHSTPELLAILAHEIGHYKLRHIYKMIALSVLVTGLNFFILSRLINHPGIFSAFSMDHQSIYMSLIFIGLLFSPLNHLFSIATNAISRSHEYQADRFAINATNSSKTLSTALIKLSANNLSNLTPHPLKVFLDYSHPPLLNRLTRLKQ